MNVNPEDRRKLFERVAKIQVEIGDIPQTGVGYGYTYSTLSDIWSRLAPLLEKYKLGVISIHDWDEDVGWCLVTRVFLRENPDVYWETMMPMSLPILAREKKIVTGVIEKNMMPATPQEWGSLTTYWRRYSLINLFFLVSGVPDDDAQIAQAGMAERSRQYVEDRYQRRMEARADTGRTARLKAARAAGKPAWSYDEIKQKILARIEALEQKGFEFEAAGGKTADQRRTTSKNLGMVKLKGLIGEDYVRDFLRDLIGVDDLNLATDPEIQALWYWMDVSRERNWAPSPRAVAEAEVVRRHFSGEVDESEIQSQTGGES